MSKSTTYTVHIPSMEIYKEFVPHRPAFLLALEYPHVQVQVKRLVRINGVVDHEEAINDCTCDACHDGLCAVNVPCKRKNCRQPWCVETITRGAKC